MLYIDDDNNIKLTRGNTAYLSLEIEDDEGQPYDYSADTVTFTVKRNTITKEVILQKQFEGGSIKIEPSDTERLDYELLTYDVKLVTPSGDVFTVIDPSIFMLTEEVNFNVD